MQKEDSLARVKRTLMFTSYLMASVVLILIAIELVVKTLFPQINYQGIQRSLLLE